MKKLGRIFNTLTICSISGIGCVPMVANFILNSNKNFNINTKHNSLTTQQIKDKSGIAVDDYQSMMVKYIKDNGNDLDRHATDMFNTNSQDGKTLHLYQTYPSNAQWINTKWVLCIPEYLYVNESQDKHEYKLTFISKNENLKNNLLVKSLPSSLTSNDFEISMDNDLGKGYLPEDENGSYKVPHYDSPKLYECFGLVFSNFFNWDKNIPSSCFKISSDGKNIIFDPSNMSKKYYQDTFWTGFALTQQDRTCFVGDWGEAAAKWWTLASSLVNPNDNAIYSGFKYDPSQLFQFDKVGMDKDTHRIYSQSSLNKHLLKVALSTKFNQQFINPNNNWNVDWLDVEASGTSTIKDNDGKIIPNPNTLIHLENTEYWGTMLGEKTAVAGGLDLWFPIGDTGQKDAQGKSIIGLKDFKSYTQPEYINTVNKIFSKLKDYANPNYNGTNSMCLTYDNYFKLRDWCWRYCTSGKHVMPTIDQDPNTSILAALNSNNLTNSDWVQWKNGSLNAGTDNDPILVNPKSVDYLEQLAITLKAIKFDEWNNYDSTGLGTTSGNWDNALESKYIEKNVSYEQIASGFNKKYYDNLPVDKNTPIIVTTNMRSMMPGQNDKTGIEKIGVQTNEQYIDETHTYSLSNTNNIENLSALTGGKIHLQQNVNFQCGSDKVTTTGISIAQEGRIAKTYNNADLFDKVQVQIRCYDDPIGKEFYDESQPTKNFNARAYELDKHDLNNQPYQLKSATEVYNIAKSHTNGDSDEAVLKNMFYDYKNNCPATPILDVDMYDDENFDYNLEEEIPNLKLVHRISDADGKMTISVVNTSDPSHPVPVKDCDATFSGFRASITPIPQPKGVTPNIVGIVAGSVLGSVAVVGIIWYIVWNRCRSTKRLHPDIKKLKREGSYEE